MCSLLWVFDVFRTLVFWTHHGGFTALSTSTTAAYVICCTAAVIHGGWVDRFAGVTVVLRSADVLLSVGG